MNADKITRSLTSFWVGTRQQNLAELERYYGGAQTLEDNGMFTKLELSKEDVQRAWKPVNYLASVVDEPVGYLSGGRFRVTTQNERVQAWADSYFNRRIKPRLDDLVRWQALYGEAFLHLWTDREGISRGLKIDVLAPVDGGQAAVMADYGQDSEELTGAIIYKRAPLETKDAVEEYRITLSNSRIVVERREVKGGRSSKASAWVTISDEVNTADSLPVIPFFNPIPSDVMNMIPIQDDLDKLHVDLRLARAYYGSPVWTTSADAGDIEVGPGRILFGADYKQFDLPSLQPLLDERLMHLESAAKVTKSLVLRNEAGGSPSGVSLQYQQQSFLERLTGKAQRIESGLELTLMTAARLITTGADLYALETNMLEPDLRPSMAELLASEFAVTLEPNIPADIKANAEVAGIWLNELGVSHETALAKAGIEDPAGEAQKARLEREAERAPKPPPPPGTLEQKDDEDGEE